MARQWWAWCGVDGWRLALLGVVAAGVHAWLVSQTVVPARDGVMFARQAYRLDTSVQTPDAGGPLGVIRSSEHPPGYPLAVGAMAHVTGSGSPLPDRFLLAAQVVNALAAVLLVIPSYFIGRQLWGPNVGFAAALLFQVLPVPARVTSDALSEGLFLLAVVTAVALAVRAVQAPRLGWFVLCGVAAGAAYLVRPEGLMAALPPVAVTAWAVAARRVSVGRAAVRVGAIAAGVGLLAIPYVTLIGKLTNKPTGQELQAPLGKAPMGAGPLFAAWREGDEPGWSRAAWAVTAVGAETAKATHYVIGPLAVIGVIVLWRRFRGNPGWWVLVLTPVVNLALLLYLAVRKGYVSERHTLLLTLLACQFAAAVLPEWAGLIGRLIPPVGRLGRRVTAAVLLGLLCLASLPFAVKPLHRNREGHKAAGRWLATQLAPADAVIDPYTWAEWYSGHGLLRPGEWTAELPPVTYVVLENTAAAPESPLPMLNWAREVAARPGAEVVYQWPEGVPATEAKVRVVRVGGGE
jgi:hypothetical protein